MLHRLASNMARIIVKKANIDDKYRSIYEYGCELFLSTSASILSIIFFSLVLNVLYSSIVFLTVFMGIRFFSGGYHATTYFHCFVLTNLVYLISYIASLAFVKYIGIAGEIFLIWAAAYWKERC